MRVQFAKFYYFKLKGFFNRFKRLTSKNISRSSYIASGVQFLGLDQISIGKNCTIGQNTVFTVNNRASTEIQLKIDDNTYIGRNNFFAVGKSIEIGAYCIFGNNCAIMGSDHIFNTPLKPYITTGATTDKSIKIGVNCWLGYGISVLGNITIGHGSIIGANSVVTKNIPPFSLAIGNPARIIKRFNFNLNTWEKGESIEDSAYLDESKYLEYLREHFGSLPVAYYSSSSKFGDI